VKTPELRVVLEAARAGARLASHAVHGPATLLVLEGALEIRTSRGSFRVGEAEMATLPRDEQREIHSLARSLFLLALSPAPNAEKRRD
jgi:quercetin dioxygenase-like cupin family protein